MEETRIALIGIIVENKDSVERLNAILHDNAEYIVGRMGLPLKEKGINVISVVMDAPQNVISSLSGKIGMLDGINSKVIYDRVR
ncbi:MAG: iron-only hydrogenase system regulator [Lachnospiraceae bacterium]|nr:iron-only hydrogenase system regulator [Candidatus Colinaster scatohippi]